jgi:isopropylmalate/homocitrate/citramalate synthase
MRKTEAEVLEIITATVARARNLVEDVEWSAMDATRTGIDYLCQCVDAAIKAGATTINLPDTVGYATPEEYAAMFCMVRERVPSSDKVRFSTHCHNDLGLAVANSLAALDGGARQIECTINGIGERAGNAALEEIVMAIKTRGDRLPYQTGIDATMLSRASRLVSAVTNFPVQYNKAIVGRNAFAHESGIHQDGILKYQQTYEIMTPESVGVAHSNLGAIRIGRHRLLLSLGSGSLGSGVEPSACSTCHPLSARSGSAGTSSAQGLVRSRLRRRRRRADDPRRVSPARVKKNPSMPNDGRMRPILVHRGG